MYAVFVLGEKDALWCRVTALFTGKYILCNTKPEKNLSISQNLLVHRRHWFEGTGRSEVVFLPTGNRF